MGFFADKKVDKEKFLNLYDEYAKLNDENIKDHSNFYKVILNDEKMIAIYSQMKLLKEKHRFSFSLSPPEDKFYNGILRQIKNVYNLLLINAFNNEEDEIPNELLELKNSIEVSKGHGFDHIVDLLLNDIDEKIDNYKMYRVVKKDDDSFMEPLYNDIVKFVVTTGKVSASLLQRKYKLNYSRAAKVIDSLEKQGIIGPMNDGKPRDVLISLEQMNDGKFINVYKSSDDYYLEKMSIDEYYNYQEEKENTTLFLNDNNKNLNNEALNSIFSKYHITPSYDEKNNLFNRVENSIIVHSMSDTDKINFINCVLKYYDYHEAKLLLIDESKLIFFEYNFIPHMLRPTITESSKIIGILDLLEQEVRTRLDIFTISNVKRIEQYNEKVENDNRVLKDDEKKCKMPYIFVVVQEANNKEILSNITNILLNGQRTGIAFVGFSRYSKGNLHLGSTRDLIKIYDDYVTFEKDILADDYIEILDEEKEMNGFDFENYSAKLLMANGFSNAIVTQASGDFGVDIIAYKDDVKYAIQCKKYSTPVGIKAVQEVLGSKSMHNCHVAVVLTNSTFTKSARELAKKNNVLLWDEKKLNELIKNYENSDNVK